MTESRRSRPPFHHAHETSLTAPCPLSDALLGNTAERRPHPRRRSRLRRSRLLRRDEGEDAEHRPARERRAAVHGCAFGVGGLHAVALCAAHGRVSVSQESLGTGDESESARRRPGARPRSRACSSARVTRRPALAKWHLGFGDKPKPDWNAELKPGPLELGFDHYFGIPVVNSHPPFVWVEDHRVVGLDPADPLSMAGRRQRRAFPEKMMAPGDLRGRRRRTRSTATTNSAQRSRKRRWRGCGRTRNAVLPLLRHAAHPSSLHARRASSRAAAQAGRYGDFIQEFDWMVGEVMRTLDELRLRDNTLVILTSDNGGMLNQGGQDAWKAGHRLNGDLLGFKFDAWEGGHRVPFIARWPGKIEAGSVSDQLICHIDLLGHVRGPHRGRTPARRSPGQPATSCPPSSADRRRRCATIWCWLRATRRTSRSATAAGCISAPAAAAASAAANPAITISAAARR